MTAKRYILGLLALCFTVTSFASHDLPQPFVAQYNIEWRGMGAGTSTLELVRLGGEDYSYRSRNLARGFFKVAFPDAITQTSEFSLVNGVVTPRNYRSDDGSPDTARDVVLHFDWQTREATGTAEDKPVKVALQPGTQDSLSVQIALMCELAAGRAPERFWLLDKDKVKEYHYRPEGNATLETPLGKLETVIYRSERTGSNRVTRLWLAPSLGFVAVRAEQSRRGKREFSLSIRALTRN